ncbi:hypothetical protein D3C79_754090 [compost metagenome]
MVDAQVVGAAIQKGSQVANLAALTVHQPDKGILQKVAGGFPTAHAAGQKGQQFAAMMLIEQRQAAVVLVVGHGVCGPRIGRQWSL